MIQKRIGIPQTIHLLIIQVRDVDALFVRVVSQTDLGGDYGIAIEVRVDRGALKIV
jgi:hypothetical protein